MGKEEHKQLLEQETEKLASKERERLIIDFDEAVQEQKSDPVIVKFQGEEFALPQDAPAWLPLFINRHMGEDGIIDDKHNLKLIERLLGKDFADKILESDNFVSFELVNNKILKPVMDHWGMGFEDQTAKNETTHS